VSLFDLSGKVALITGSSRGIGRAIALRMAQQGAKVAISSRKLDACEQVVSEIEAAHGPGRAVAVAASISVKDELKRLVEQTQVSLGEIDILVCNAASNPYYGPMAGIDDDKFRKILDNNILSNHWLIQLTAPSILAPPARALKKVS
jgi:NAD(P)-dependent dehydrogenase (short-subunit alcohol dehydrogenase family)